VGARFKLPPGGDVPAVVAARRLGMTVYAFEAKLSELVAAGFPPPNRVTGNFPIEAIDAWRLAAFPQLLPERLTPSPPPRDVRSIVAEKVARLRSG
jgi:hypothetical protein